MTPTPDALRNAAQAMARFFAFFCVLAVSLAAFIMMYIWLVSSPFDKAWSVVAAVALTALVLLILTVIATMVPGLVERLRSPAVRAAEGVSQAQEQRETDLPAQP